MIDESKYHFFWHGIFSQWAIYDMFDPIKGIGFSCCEQYMMYNKAMLFNDKKTAGKILSARTPKDQKRLGRSIKPFNDKIWDAVKREVVWRGNFLKFTQNPKLLKELLNTGEKILVEASPYDKIWGIGLSSKEAKLINPDDWPGQNLLGEVLTNLRDELILLNV
jgi:ribA/ribD-fused uncharacterized protein